MAKSNPPQSDVSTTPKKQQSVSARLITKKVAAKQALSGKASAKPVVRVAAKLPAAAKPVADGAKPKLVRDSFTMPKPEYAAIETLKQRSAQLARPVKKSELLRAGIKALSAMSDKTLLVALQAVPTLKTGRPHKG